MGGEEIDERDFVHFLYADYADFKDFLSLNTKRLNPKLLAPKLRSKYVSKPVAFK